MRDVKKGQKKTRNLSNNEPKKRLFRSTRTHLEQSKLAGSAGAEEGLELVARLDPCLVGHLGGALIYFII